MRHTELPRVLRRMIGLIRYAREAVRANSASLFLLDAARTSLRGVVSEWDWTRTSFDAEVGHWPTVARCLEDGAVRVIACSAATGSEKDWFGPRGIVAAVCVPLRFDDQSWGVIFFDYDGSGESFDDDDIAFLTDVGKRGARALGRAPSETLVVERPMVLPRAEVEQSIDVRLASAVSDLVAAETLLEEAVAALRTGTKEKVALAPDVERAFAQVRAARDTLVRIRLSVTE